MGKRKYRATYRDSSYAKNNSKAVCIPVNSCPLPGLVPYNKCMPFIKCGLQKGSSDNKCIICSNSLLAKIEASIKEGKNLISR